MVTSKMPARVPIRAKPHRGHARRINDTPHALLPCRLKQCPRALDIRSVHLLRIAHPQPVIGRHMKHDFAASDCLLNRSRIAQIPDHALRIQIRNIPQIARSPHQQPQLSSLGSQSASHMTAQKPVAPVTKAFN